MEKDLKKNGRQPKKMEDDLKKIIIKKNGRRLQKNGRRTNQPKST